MKPFLDQDFLLTTDTAKRLYHGIAAACPIIDYHCHLNPRETARRGRCPHRPYPISTERADVGIRPYAKWRTT